jgi:signal transduction histidine kinase
LNDDYKKIGDGMIGRLNQAADILDNLHEPWRQQPDTPTDVNKCIQRALDKIIPDPHIFAAKEHISLHKVLADDLSPVHTSPDMLTEAIRVLIKNGIEAIKEKIQQNGQAGELWVNSYPNDNGTVEIVVRDNGIGIKSEHMGQVFELGWSTKEVGMGFGLFWAKDYIEGLGGTIKAQSVWREGASFRIQLPALPTQ